jgi:NADH dehydrogenase
VIINCVGIIREDNESFKEAHVDLVRWLVRLAKKLKVRQFVQLSALGVEHESTAYQRSKLQAEHIIQASGLPYAIIRPSMIFGPGDRSINMFRSICRTGFYPVLGKGTTQPVSVDTVAAMIAAAADLRIRDRVVELGGPEVFTYAQLADRIHPGVRAFAMPRPLVRLVSLSGVLIRSLPTKEMVMMLRQANVTKDRTVDRLKIKNPRLV